MQNAMKRSVELHGTWLAVVAPLFPTLSAVALPARAPATRCVAACAAHMLGLPRAYAGAHIHPFSARDASALRFR